MSQDAKNLYQAQQEAASMAEILEKDIDSLDNISVYYDKDWNQCDKEEKMYWLEVTQTQNQVQEDDLKKVKIEYLHTVKGRDIIDKYIPERKFLERCIK